MTRLSRPADGFLEPKSPRPRGERSCRMRAVARRGVANIDRMTAKEKLHEQVDALSEEQAERMLDLVGDPVVEAFRDATLDDEELTPKEETAIAEADADFAAGRTVTHEAIKRELDTE